MAEKSFPPNGLLGCLCTVSWWLQPTSSKTKGHVSKTPSQLTLIGIAVDWSCESRPAWTYTGCRDGACSTEGRSFSQILLVGTHVLIFPFSDPCFCNVYHLQHCYFTCEKIHWKALCWAPCHWEVSSPVTLDNIETSRYYHLAVKNLYYVINISSKYNN